MKLTKCLYTSFMFGICGIISIVKKKEAEGTGMMIISITSILNHTLGYTYLIYIDRICALSVGLYMTIFHFRLCYLIFGSIPLISFLLRVKNEEKLGLINQNEHLYTVHIPILLGFISIIKND